MDALIRVPKVLQDAKQTERSFKGKCDSASTHKRLYFKTMRKKGRLTLHVRRLVHISQVSSGFSEKSMSVQLH